MDHRHDLKRSADLDALVDNEDYDALARATTPEEIAETWCCYQDRGGAGQLAYTDPDWWAVNFFWRDEWQDHEFGRRSLVALAERVPEEYVDLVGASAVENFLSNDESRVAWVEEQSIRSDKFRRALRNVWTWGSESDEIAARIEKAAGVPLASSKRSIPN